MLSTNGLLIPAVLPAYNRPQTTVRSRHVPAAELLCGAGSRIGPLFLTGYLTYEEFLRKPEHRLFMTDQNMTDQPSLLSGLLRVTLSIEHLVAAQLTRPVALRAWNHFDFRN